MRLFETAVHCQRRQQGGDFPARLRSETNQDQTVTGLNNREYGQAIIGLKNELEKMNPAAIDVQVESSCLSHCSHSMILYGKDAVHATQELFIVSKALINDLREIFLGLLRGPADKLTAVTNHGGEFSQGKGDALITT